ncbi:transcriptional regulator [Cedecea colo]|uniref:Transcriptional regulator n=1 Tax=Cedecea colo TaxID=2552946 RepID=A0ABX0VJS0_9ENTR|nr:transcriptional regulator [Cedecea colo]NIY47304.1 transcriptional regulator [Cedecea colo]
MSNDLLRWRKSADKEEWAALAQLVGTSVGYMNLIAYGVRRASPARAAAIEKGTKLIGKHTPVTKESLVFMNTREDAA